MNKQIGKNILVVFAKITAGGMERANQVLLKYLQNTGYNVTAVTLRDAHIPNACCYGGAVISLKKNGRMDIIKPILLLSRIIVEKKPNVIISSLGCGSYILFIAQLLGKIKVSYIFIEHSCLSQYIKTIRWPKMFNKLIRIIYSKADKIIAVSNGAKSDLIEICKISPSKIVVINNPLDSEQIKGLLSEGVDRLLFHEKKYRIITCGRLSKEKNQILLLDAFKKVLDQIDAKLIIIGDGPEREHLAQYAEKLNIMGSVCFLGYQDNPYKYISKADLFVLSSDTESFGYAIIEAMMCKIPVISTDCFCGPREIITNGVNGILVPVDDADAISKAIFMLFDNRSFAMTLAEKGLKRAADFNADIVFNDYKKIIDSLCYRE